MNIGNLLNIGSEQMHFEWGASGMFYILLLAPLVYLLIPKKKVKATSLYYSNYQQAVNQSKAKPSKKAWVVRKGPIQWIMISIIFVLLVIGSANPKLVGQPKQEIITARSFLITADMSFSMDTKDWQVNDKKMTRWHAVQAIMSDFIAERKSDRMGLVLFASNSYLQCPLTNDLKSVDWMLQSAEVGMAGQMTGIGDAIGYSMKVLKEDTSKSKVILLLTDGIDGGQGTNPMDAAKIAQKDSIKIYTIGIGSTTGHDKIDEKAMTRIAELTGGKYFRAMDQSELTKAYKELDKLEPLKFKKAALTPEVLLYTYPVIAAIVLGIFLLFFLTLFSLFKRNR